jgi:ABC-type cobalamin transport system permease subunit
VFALLPVVSLLIAATVANMNDCALDEASAHACVLLGVDWGGLLAFMAMAGWLVFFTVPLGGLAALLGLVVYIAARVLERKTR